MIDGLADRRSPRARQTRRGQRWLRGVIVVPALGLSVLAVRALGGEPQADGTLRGRRLYVDPDTPARKQADAWQRSRPREAVLMRRIAEQPQAIWLGEWVRDIRAEADNILSRSASTRAVPVLVAYNIPYRDCGLHSRGGAGGGDDYRRWIVELARGLRNRPSVVILEPDGLPAMDCLPARLRDERFVLLRDAVDVLTKAGASVYVDAGNANWQQPSEMARRLQAAGIAIAEGFSLNVSNFHATSVNVAYGDRLSRLVGGKHYVIDTSRNGRGASVEREWCNAPNQALGYAPTTNTGLPLVDAYLWVKTPGQSDGNCNGGPRAGEWWPEYALGLSRTAEQLGSMRTR
jgi:endoglucanase